MQIIPDTYEMLSTRYGTWGLLLMVTILALFALQLYYYLGCYSSIPKFRNRAKNRKREVDGISVVVVMGNDRWYVENVLPRLMKQKFRAFEVVIVTVGAEAEFLDELEMLKHRYPNLTATKIDEAPRFPISNKMAYNVGIKAASYENIILTTTEAMPTSDRWLECMGRGFSTGEVLIAYCGMEQRKGFANKVMRSDRFMMSVRYLSSAIKGKPFRGIIHNMGFTKSIYFAHKGFDYLNMNLGEDDLFIKRIATANNTSIVLHPHATMRQVPWGGLQWWSERQRFYASTFRFYPDYAKNAREWETGSRLLFFLAAITAMVIMPLEIQIATLAIFIIRLVLVRFSMWRVRQRLNERRLGWALTLYDLYSPVSDIVNYLHRLVRPVPGVWR